jgi:dethiobiotin synthetase
MTRERGAIRRSRAADPSTPGEREAVHSNRLGTLVIVSGTGTGIGKTHFAETLLLAWRSTGRVVGLKPVESGVQNGATTDAARLAAASSFHVKQEGYAFAAPLSPHLAARDEGIQIRQEVIADLVQQARQRAEGVVLELAGGLFSPLTDTLGNADLAKALFPESILLVAPDRLGVLHDVVATTRAASGMNLRIDGLVLMAPDQGDASTGRNAPELLAQARFPVLAALPRGSPAELCRLPQMTQLVERITKK